MHVRVSAELRELPDDFAEAFEQFKLAIIRQRQRVGKTFQRATWSELLSYLRKLSNEKPE